MSRTALVTGARGFTGGRLVTYLLDRGWTVVATDLEPDGREAFYTETENAPHPVYEPRGSEGEETTFIPADLTAPETLVSLFERRTYDAVFHVASLFDYFAEWEALYAVNVEGARNIAELAAKNGVEHFVHVSTLGVAGAAGFDEPNDETAPYEPHNRYCESKMQQEQALKTIADEQGLRLTILRSAPIYGPGNQYGVYHIPLVLSKMGVAPVYRIYPRRKQLQFPSIHVDDLCRLAGYVTDNRSRTVGETYNAVSDCIGQDELVSFLADSVGVRKVRIPIPHRLYGLLSTYAQSHSQRIQRIARERGKRPKIDASITNYLSSNMWFSNRKVSELGFEFEYRDPRRGLWDYVTWCKEEGYLP